MGTHNHFNKKASRVVYSITFLRLPVTRVKKSLKSGFSDSLLGRLHSLSAPGPSSSVLLRLEGWNTGPTDPDYVQADAPGIWTVFVRAVLDGSVIGLLTFALVATYMFPANAGPRSSDAEG